MDIIPGEVLAPSKQPIKKNFAGENSGQLTARLAALAAKLAAARHGGPALGTLARHQRGATLLTESRTTAVCRLAVGAVNRPRKTTRVFSIVASGWHAVATIPRDTTAMPPSMALVIAWAAVIVIVMMPTVATASVVATQQHVK